MLINLAVFIGASHSSSRSRRRRQLQRNSSAGNHSQRASRSEPRAPTVVPIVAGEQLPPIAHVTNFESLSNEIASQIEKRKQIEYKLISRRFHEAMIDPSREDYICNICLNEFRIGEEISESANSKCLHMFHTECIVDWLVERNDRPCPVCRRDFFNQ